MAADAYHLTGTAPDGIGAVLGMRKAMQDAGIQPHQISYINAHATSTAIGDASELTAIAQLFGDRREPVWVSATKSMTGHLLGAAGAIESIFCVLAVQQNIIPPTINLEHADFDLPQGIRIAGSTVSDTEVQYALNNTFGFGGHTASSVFKKYTGR